MNWYYVLNGKQVGPVAESELSRLLANGTISAATMVWREGQPDWQPLSAVLPNVVSNPDAPQLGGMAVPLAQKDMLVQQMREGVASTAPGSMRYAGFWIRFVAKFVDIIILQVVQFVLGLLVGIVVGVLGARGDGAQAVLTIGLVVMGLAINVAYQTIMIGKYAATVGKMAVGVRVVKPDGGRVSMGNAAGRYFGEMLSGLILSIGYIMAAFDEEKRALHDRICETRVIYK